MKTELTLSDFEKALISLNNKLDKSNEKITIKTVGGYALLFYKLRESGVTQDIDTVTKNYNEKVNSFIKEVAIEQNINNGWLNNGMVLDDVEIIESLYNAFWIKNNDKFYNDLSHIDFYIADIDTMIMSKLIAVDDGEFNNDREQDIPDLLNLLKTKNIKTRKDFQKKFNHIKQEYPYAFNIISKKLL